MIADSLIVSNFSISETQQYAEENFVGVCRSVPFEPHAVVYKFEDGSMLKFIGECCQVVS